MRDAEKHINQMLDSYQLPVRRSKQEAWELLEQKLGNEPAVKRHSFIGYWISGAVAAIIIMLLGLFQSGIFSPVEQNPLIAEQTVWLPDSSMVLLNARSKVTYNYQLIGGKRQIELDGEAYFKVEKGKPFCINFPGGKLQVLGTEFNLSAYANNFIQIDCVSGKVEIETHGQKITLTKNQGMSFIAGKLSGPYTVSEDDIKNRLDGYYKWKQESLEQLFSYIGYRFGYTVKIDESLKSRKFGGTLPLKNLQETTDVLSAAMQLKIDIDEKGKRLTVSK